MGFRGDYSLRAGGRKRCQGDCGTMTPTPCHPVTPLPSSHPKTFVFAP